MDRMEVTSLQSRYYMGIPVKELTVSMSLRTKRPKDKKRRFYITDITKQIFRKLINKFNNSYYLGYKSKQVPNEYV